MMTTNSSSGQINIAASAQKIKVDNRFSLCFYYRSAANILKQMSGFLLPVLAFLVLLSSTAAACPVDFEMADAYAFRSRCPPPDYPPKHCCAGFREFTCKYQSFLINDRSCVKALFLSMSQYGYPPYVFNCPVEPWEGDCPSPSPVSEPDILNCPVHLDTTPFTSGCRDPFNQTECCTAFLNYACKYQIVWNDTMCYAAMFTSIPNADMYPTIDFTFGNDNKTSLKDQCLNRTQLTSNGVHLHLSSSTVIFLLYIWFSYFI